MPSPKNKHLIIDGYNIIHAWPKLKKMLLQKQPGAARESLCKAVRLIHDVEGIHVTVVFDGQGDEVKIERPTPEVTFSIVYATKDLSADGLIEQLACKKKKNVETIVASEDNFIRQAVSAAGGTVITANDLLEWVNACERRQVRNIKNHKKSTDEEWKQESPWDKLL